MWITLVAPQALPKPPPQGAALTEAQGLSPDAHHPPQLPRGAGQQQVTGEPGEAGATGDFRV